MMYCDNLYNETIQLTQLQYSSCHCASKFQLNTWNFDAQCMMNTVFSHYRYSTRTCSYCLLLIPTLCFAICVIWAGRDGTGRGGAGRDGWGSLLSAQCTHLCSWRRLSLLVAGCRATTASTIFVASGCILCPSDFLTAWHCMCSRDSICFFLFQYDVHVQGFGK